MEPTTQEHSLCIFVCLTVTTLHFLLSRISMYSSESEKYKTLKNYLTLFGNTNLAN